MEIVFIIFLDGGRSVILLLPFAIWQKLTWHESFKMIIFRLIFSDKFFCTHEAPLISPFRSFQFLIRDRISVSYLRQSYKCKIRI